MPFGSRFAGAVVVLCLSLIAVPVSAQVAMWGATGGASSTLFSVDPDTAATTSIGPIGIAGVTGLAALPDGRLVASANDGDGSQGDGDNSILLDINRTNGAGALIGVISNLNTGCARMPDLTWDGLNSTLYGYGDFCGGPAEGLFTINTTTGAGTSVGASGYSSGGNGLAWDHTTDTMYGTPVDNGSLVTLNRVTGAGTDVPGSVGNVPSRVNALAVHPVTGVLYGVLNGAQTGTNYGLVTIDKITGDVTLIGELPARFDAITFDQTAPPIPSVSQIGLAVMLLLFAAAGVWIIRT